MHSAAQLASEGFRVFPLRRSADHGEAKRPIDAGWQAFATSDADIAERRWTGQYSGCGIGVRTGNGLLVIDVDNKPGRDGASSLFELEMELGALPCTREATTPSGGRHLYFSVPAEAGIRNAVDKRPGVDWRGEGGYVVGPGSVLPGGSYSWVDPDVPIAALPEAWTAFCRSRSRVSGLNGSGHGVALSDPDTPAGVERAIRHLRDEAPESVQNAGGDKALFLACVHLVHDFAISRGRAFELVQEHFNRAGKAIPPWDDADVWKKIDSAIKSGQSAIGSGLGVAEFVDASAEVEELERSRNMRRSDAEGGLWITGITQGSDADVLAGFKLDGFRTLNRARPPREWLAGRFLARRFVTGLVAPPGAGKTSLEIAVAVALCTGRADIAGMEIPSGRQRVFLWNQEDEYDELERRLEAVMKAFGVSEADMQMPMEGGGTRPALVLASGIDRPLLIAAKAANGRMKATKEADALLTWCRREEIGVAMFDPFAELHSGGEENDNIQMVQVGQVFRRMAVQGGMAVLLAHHTRKPPAGDSTGHWGNMDSARGAGSLVGVIRIGMTLYGLDAATARAAGVPESERYRYMRFDDGKASLALGDGRPRFYRKEGVQVGSFENSEEVGLLRPVVLERRSSKRDDQAMLSLIEAVVTEKGIPVADVARHVMMVDEMYADEKPDTVRKAIKMVIENHPECLQMSIQNWPGKSGKIAIAFRKVRENQEDQEES